jgi:4-amino-4-deoxy-L-arabinose transferase-like glycosyltransferase
MRLLKDNWDFGLLGALVGGFAFVAAQRIGSVPVPDNGDESMLLQIPYEIIYRGKFAWPMCRYLGGNIENAWHSFRPGLFLMSAGFFKVFGWGLTQGRVFNLITAALTLVMVYVVGRRLFDWRTGLTGVAMLISDQVFFERSRMVRYEHPAAMVALLAFYLYEIAEERRSKWLYIASGLAAGTAVMVHTNLIYLPVAILALMLIRHGARVFAGASLYQFSGAAFLVMAYEIIWGIADRNNVRLQYHDDPAHFSVTSASALWQNLQREVGRYESWYQGGELVYAGRPVLLRFFMVLTLISIIYLVYVCIAKIRSGNARDDARIHVLVVTGFAMMFLALATGRRRKYAIYMTNLTPWFALCAGIAVRDGLEFLKRLGSKDWRLYPMARKAVISVLVLGVACYGLLFLRQNYKYYKVLNSPDHASFQEFTAVLRGMVPDGVCPISIVRPVIWLSFPEADRCYATLERRMGEPLDIAGKDYALIIPGDNHEWIRDPNASYHFLGEMDDTPYGDIRVYYTGSNPELIRLQPKRFQFFGSRRGYVDTTNRPSAAEVDAPTDPKVGVEPFPRSLPFGIALAGR